MNKDKVGFFWRHSVLLFIFSTFVTGTAKNLSPVAVMSYSVGLCAFQHPLRSFVIDDSIMPQISDQFRSHFPHSVAVCLNLTDTRPRHLRHRHPDQAMTMIRQSPLRPVAIQPLQHRLRLSVVRAKRKP